MSKVKTLAAAIVAILIPVTGGSLLANSTNESAVVDFASQGYRPSIFEAIILDKQNDERTRYGVAPLKWSLKLSADAQIWAQHLAQTRQFEHADQPGGDDASGENLWMGTRSAYMPEEMVGMWLDERSGFVPGNFPKVSRSGRWQEIGHYTQLIWPETRYVGCAVASNSEDDYLVCRYWPAGNVIGENVGIRRQNEYNPK